MSDSIRLRRSEKGFITVIEEVIGERKSDDLIKLRGHDEYKRVSAENRGRLEKKREGMRRSIGKRRSDWTETEKREVRSTKKTEETDEGDSEVTEKEEINWGFTISRGRL